MLLSKLQEKPSFDFIPGTQGCFSFQANADLRTLSRYEKVREQSESWSKIDRKSYVAELKQCDKQALLNLKETFAHQSLEQLTKITDRKYPFYAVNIALANNVSDSDSLGRAGERNVLSNESRLFTIGYEGISLETYLNKLIKYGVKSLLDVRRNSFSMKYGFSKHQLKDACHEINVKYYHLPELGIESSKRKKLKSQSDYDLLFEEYKRINLLNTVGAQRRVIDLIEQHQRVALTCFEADICQCHRKPLAESISELSGSIYEVEHL